MLLLLRHNKIKITFTQDELVELGLKMADGTYIETDLENWICEHQH